MTYTNSTNTDKSKLMFYKDRSAIKPLEDYLEIARETLVKVVENYKNLYGKSSMD